MRKTPRRWSNLRRDHVFSSAETWFSVRHVGRLLKSTSRSELEMDIAFMHSWLTDNYRFGKVNILVNNASKQYTCKDFADIDLDKVENLFHTNIIQMFAVTKYALPHMTRGDSIINTTSTVTFRGSSSMVDYASSKGAIVGFTRSLAMQLVSKGIRVNAVA